MTVQYRITWETYGCFTDAPPCYCQFETEWYDTLEKAFPEFELNYGDHYHDELKHPSGAYVNHTQVNRNPKLPRNVRIEKKGIEQSATKLKKLLEKIHENSQKKLDEQRAKDANSFEDQERAEYERLQKKFGKC